MKDCLSCSNAEELNAAGLCQWCQDERDQELAQERLEEESDWHSDMWRPRNPAINVKLYNWPKAEMLKHPLVRAYFEAATDEDHQTAWEIVSEMWWYNDMPLYVDDFGFDEKHFHSEGRSGGWLVHTNTDWKYWDGERVQKWLDLSEMIRNNIKEDVPVILAFETARIAALRMDNNELLDWTDIW